MIERAFSTSLSAEPMMSPRSRPTKAIWSWMALTMSLMRSAFSAESCARLRMSVATTTKPLPYSPARAASMLPLTASMLVWMDTWVMASTILSILRLTSSRSLIWRMLLRVAPTPAWMLLISASMLRLLSVINSRMAAARSLAWAARCSAIWAPFSIWVTAAADSVVAAAWPCAPLRICSSATRIWLAEREISCTAEDSSSAELATSSALLEMSVAFFRSSASSDRLCAVCSHSDKATVCSATVLLASSQADDCSAAAEAICSAPLSACCAATLLCAAAEAISAAPEAMSAESPRMRSSCSVITELRSTSDFTFSAASLMPSAITLTSPWIWPTSSWICLALFSDVSASVRTSSATTAKPLPCLPARAASMAAFRASRLVWSAMRATALTMSPMLAAWRSSSPTILTESAWRSAATVTLWMVLRTSSVMVTARLRMPSAMRWD